jgi:hypothetical protein
VLGDLPGDTHHVCRSPHKNVVVAPEEINELTFPFWAQTGPGLDSLGRVLSIDPDGLGILSGLEGAGRGGHGQFRRRGLCVEAELLQLNGSDYGSDQLYVI